MFGSCFGHQIIAQALLSGQEAGIGLGLGQGGDGAIASGRTVPSTIANFHVEHSSKGFEMGIQGITLNSEFTDCFPPLAKSWMFRIQLIHGDTVVPTFGEEGKVDLPAPWMNIGSSASCEIQGLYLPGRILTYQGHFEFDAWGNAELTKYFGLRFGWDPRVVKDYIGEIERSVISGQEDDDDDSKAAAEAVLLLFAGRDGNGQDEGQDGIRAEALAVEGMLTPPLEGGGWFAST